MSKAPELLVLVRHARPEVDSAVPASMWRLGEEGVSAARRAAERLRPVAPTIVVSSTEAKAIDTARTIAETLGLTFQTGHDLHEHERSKQGFVDAETFQTGIRRLFAEPAKRVFGDESADAAAERFGRAIDLLVKVHSGQRLVVVAHGTVMALHLERRFGLDGLRTWESLGMPSYVVVDRRTRMVLDAVRDV